MPLTSMNRRPELRGRPSPKRRTTAVVVAPDGAPARLVRPWIYAGLFLDEAVTRTAFTVSPPPPTAPRVGPLPQPAVRLLLPADITAYPSRALVDART